VSINHFTDHSCCATKTTKIAVSSCG